MLCWPPHPMLGIVPGSRQQQWENNTSPGAYIQPQLTMSSSCNVCRVGVLLVLMCIFNKWTEDSLSELSPQQYFSTLQPGKASLGYFCQAGKHLKNSYMILELFVLLTRQYIQWELSVKGDCVLKLFLWHVCLEGFGAI